MPVLAGDAGSRAAVTDVGVVWVGGGHAVFLYGDVMPVVERDAAFIGSALDARAARVLLPGAHAIGKRVVGRDVIHRRGVLVVPIAPASAAVRRDHRALI